VNHLPRHFCWLFLGLAVCNGAVLCTDDEAIARRKAMVIRFAQSDPYFSPKRKDAKYQNPIIACRLAMNPNDTAALDYVRHSLGYRGQNDRFAHCSLAGLFCRYGESWPGDLVAAVRQEATTYPGFLAGGTENHIAMERVGGYLFGERFPNERFHHGITGAQLAGICRDYFRDYGRAIYASSMVEYLSPAYHGVHTAAWLHIAELARDDSARLMGRAILDWMIADLAINHHAGIILPPLQREKGFLTDGYQLSHARSQAQWTAWLYWGGGNTPQNETAFEQAKYQPSFPSNLCADQHAVSRWNPHPVLRRIGAKAMALPYTLLQSRGNWPCIEPASINAHGKTTPTSAAHHLGPCNPRYQLRSVYVARQYAVGCGYFTENMDDPLLRTAIPFTIVWQSQHERNYLLASHPFWYTARKEEGDTKPLGDEDVSGISPFCRAVHSENCAVLLYDIPPLDPYEGKAGKGSPKSLSERTEKNIQSVFLYVPDTVQERKERKGCFFFRDGNVFVGIRPLATGATWATTRLPGYVRLALPGALTGFAVEVGDAEEFGSYEQFQQRLLSARLDTSKLQTEKLARYTSTRGLTLSIRPRKEGWLPDATVNGAPLDFERWPTCLSPYLTCRDRVLDVNDGRSGFTIDWRQQLPVYSYYNLGGKDRRWTKREQIVNGKLVVEPSADH